MMKISKPVLTNDFLLSPVQFTSLNTVVFKNVKNVYDGNEKILLEYEHSSKIEPSSRDWIGIFPRGWSTFQQTVTFEWVSQSLPSGHGEQNKENGDLTRRIIHFCPKYHMGSVSSSSFYQFVYISKQIEVLGVSAFFRFDTSSTKDSALELECLVPVSSKLRSTSFSDIGVLMANKISSATSIDTRTLQTTSIHSLQNLDPDGKSWTKSHIPLSTSDFKKPYSFPKKSTGTGDALDPYSSHSEPVFPMSFPITHCKKCFHFKRGGEFLRSQQVLQSKVGPRSEEASQFSGQRRTLGHDYLSEDKLKIVMERNKVLEERAQEMKKEMERLQAESKRLKTSYYNTNKEKVAYEKFVKDFIKSLEKDSVVRVVNGNTEFLVKKVNYVGMEEHPRDKKTSKRERELKAVIGLQEITIRNLINSLQEKAKSVQELNHTVKLAQAFSAAREDTKEFGSDAEESLDEVSNSDVTSEYEFSLSKPPPPEEVTVEDTDTVLDDIRRTTEMELKDIGISRSLGKSSSRESGSESEVPSLSVRSYQNQGEGTRPKKPRLFDNVEDCWPFANDTPKIVQRKIIDPNTKFDDLNSTDDQEPRPNSETAKDEQSPIPNQSSEPACNTEPICSETEGEHEGYYDACEAFVPSESKKAEEMPDTEEKAEENGKEKQNFLLTAIVPRDLNVKTENALKDKREVSEEKQQETFEKGKKFTCQLSIDFATKVIANSSSEGGDTKQPAIEDGTAGGVQNQIGDSSDLVPKDFSAQLNDSRLAKEKQLLSVNKCNRTLEIKITQVEQKENSNKNYLHQKMVVKFGKESQTEPEPKKNPKFEFNLAVTGLREKGRHENTEPVETEELSRTKEETNSEMNLSPRTVWNDATDYVTEDAPMPEVTENEVSPQELEEKVDVGEETGNEISDPPKEKSDASGMNLYQDSLRYEKNLEFLQQKTEEENMKGEVSKDKPTAILIQNGQTKLALIRYQ